LVALWMWRWERNHSNASGNSVKMSSRLTPQQAR
jgi:hypothetical protein